MASRNATLEDFQKIGRLMSLGKLTACYQFSFKALAKFYERDVVKNQNLFKAVIEFETAMISRN